MSKRVRNLILVVVSVVVVSVAAVLITRAATRPSGLDKANADLAKSTDGLVIAQDQQALADDVSTARALGDTRRLISSLDTFQVSGSERRKQIKMALSDVIGECLDCERLLDAGE